MAIQPNTQPATQGSVLVRVPIPQPGTTQETQAVQKPQPTPKKTKRTFILPV